MSLALEGSEDARFAPKLHEAVALQKVLKVGVAEHCLRKGLDHVDAFHLKVEERNKREEDADGCRLS
eukprot:4529101-Pleurochrysis_carterae.AAC.1